MPSQRDSQLCEAARRRVARTTRPESRALGWQNSTGGPNQRILKFITRARGRQACWQGRRGQTVVRPGRAVGPTPRSLRSPTAQASCAGYPSTLRCRVARFRPRVLPTMPVAGLEASRSRPEETELRRPSHRRTDRLTRAHPVYRGSLGRAATDRLGHFSVHPRVETNWQILLKALIHKVLRRLRAAGLPQLSKPLIAYNRRVN